MSQIKPPEGFDSWLDYAIATMDTRSLINDHLWRGGDDWPENVDRSMFRESAKAELQALREKVAESESKDA